MFNIKLKIFQKCCFKGSCNFCNIMTDKDMLDIPFAAGLNCEYIKEQNRCPLKKHKCIKVSLTTKH